MRTHSGLAPWIALTFLLAGCGGGGETGGTAEEAQEAQAPAADASHAGEMTGDADVAPPGAATGLPAGFQLRLDHENANPADYHVTTAENAVEVQTGPAGIYYDPANTVASGNYTVIATFTEIGAPINHREAYGILIGGSDLQGADQAYGYFLVRADGSYLVKKRAGSQTMAVNEGGWTKAAAVHAATGNGDVTNTLQVRVDGDQVHFSVNGTEVTTVPASAVGPFGIAGIRINHNLHVRVSDWSLATS